MERLTVMTDKGAALVMGGPYESEQAVRDDLMERYKVAVDRLAAYEDTGWTPEDIKVMHNELCLKCGLYKDAHLGTCNGCRWRREENT